jgi:hypothetical protein
MVGFVLIIYLILTTTPFFQLKPDKIDIILRPDPVFDRNAIASIMSDFA